jgi:hypothetical protein
MLLKKVEQKCGLLYSFNLNKLPIANNRHLSENSPNLVTLDESSPTIWATFEIFKKLPKERKFDQSGHYNPCCRE